MPYDGKSVDGNGMESKLAVEPSAISDKAQILIQDLLSAQDDPVCIVFAKERATVSVLHELLTACPLVTQRYRIGAVVGTSAHAARKRNIYDLPSNVLDGGKSCADFREGRIDLGPQGSIIVGPVGTSLFGVVGSVRIHLVSLASKTF